MGCSAWCANVLHGPRFCEASVLSRVQSCSPVVRRLVGIVSAVSNRRGSRGYLSAQRRDWAALGAEPDTPARRARADQHLFAAKCPRS